MAPKKAKRTSVKPRARSPVQTPVNQSSGSSFPNLHPASLRSLAAAAGLQESVSPAPPLPPAVAPSPAVQEVTAGPSTEVVPVQAGTGTGSAKLSA